MKISPIASGANTVGATDGAAAPAPHPMRALRMTTNATPLTLDTALESPAVQEPSIPPTSEANVPEADTRPLSPQFAELAKRRRSLQVKERELADREKALLEKSQGGDSISVARLKSEPMRVLLEQGVTYDDLRDAILAGQGNPEVLALKAEINALKEGVDKKFTDRETQAEQQALAEMRKEASLIVADGEDFELVRETKSIPDVMKLIERTYRESGEVLAVREALGLVENHLFEEAKRLASLGKVKSQLLPQTPPQTPRPQGMRTLTNKDTAQPPLSAKQRAIAAFYGQLK